MKEMTDELIFLIRKNVQEVVEVANETEKVDILLINSHKYTLVDFLRYILKTFKELFMEIINFMTQQFLTFIEFLSHQVSL